MTKVMEKKIYAEIKEMKKEINFLKSYIISFGVLTDARTEKEVIRDLKEGEKEYRRGETEDFEKFLGREYPELLKEFNAERSPRFAESDSASLAMTEDRD